MTSPSNPTPDFHGDIYPTYSGIHKPKGGTMNYGIETDPPSIEQINKENFVNQQAEEAAKFWAGQPVADGGPLGAMWDRPATTAGGTLMGGYPAAWPLKDRAQRSANLSYERAHKQSRIACILAEHPQFEVFLELQKLMREVDL